MTHGEVGTILSIEKFGTRINLRADLLDRQCRKNGPGVCILFTPAAAHIGQDDTGFSARNPRAFESTDAGKIVLDKTDLVP